MKIYLEKDNKTIDFEIQKTMILKDVLEKLDISLNSVILVKNNEICLEDSELSESDELKILSVVSGG